MIILPPKHEYEGNTTPTTSAGSDYGRANAEKLLQLVPTAAKQLPFVQKFMQNLPAGGAGAINALAHGETDPIEIGYNALLGEVGKQVGQVAGGPVADLLMSSVNEARQPDPNFGASTVSSAARTASGVAGQAALPFLPGVGYIIGSSIGGYFAQESIRKGYLGDWTDARPEEEKRDAVGEHLGLSNWEEAPTTEKMYEVDQAAGPNSFTGLNQNYAETPQGIAESQSNTTFDRLKNLTNVNEFYKTNKENYSFGDDQDDNVGGEKGSSTGTGGGYNDGSGGVTGL